MDSGLGELGSMDRFADLGQTFSSGEERPHVKPQAVSIGVAMNGTPGRKEG
jgi:hypothetical protein